MSTFSHFFIFFVLLLLLLRLSFVSSFPSFSFFFSHPLHSGLFLLLDCFSPPSLSLSLSLFYSPSHLYIHSVAHLIYLFICLPIAGLRSFIDLLILLISPILSLHCLYFSPPILPLLHSFSHPFIHSFIRCILQSTGSSPAAAATTIAIPSHSPPGKVALLPSLFRHGSCAASSPCSRTSAPGELAFHRGLWPLQPANWKQSPPPPASFHLLPRHYPRPQGVSPQATALSGQGERRRPCAGSFSPSGPSDPRSQATFAPPFALAVVPAQEAPPETAHSTQSGPSAHSR